MPIAALDIFCGAGGVTYGLSKAGVKVAVGVDHDDDCRLTFTQNNPSVKFLVKDVRDLSSQSLLSHAHSIMEEDFLLLAACAPCQPFSSQNRNRDNANDRAVLSHVERLVRELRPDFLFIENVPGLQKIRGLSAFRRLLLALRDLHYKEQFEVVDAAQFGIPQNRKRLVLTASLYGNPPWPTRMHGIGPGLAPFATVQDAVAGYPSLRAGEEHPTVPNHIAARLEAHNLNRIKATPNDGGSRTDWPSPLILKCHKSHDGHSEKSGTRCWAYARMVEVDVSVVDVEPIATSFYDVVPRYFCHRGFSPVT